MAKFKDTEIFGFLHVKNSIIQTSPNFFINNKTVIVNDNFTINTNSILLQSGKSLTIQHASLTVGDATGTGNITLRSNNATARSLILNSDNTINALTINHVLIAGSANTISGEAQLALSRGGTNANLTANNGGIVYSTASAFAILSGTATAGQILRSGASSAPSWSTATYPSTATNTGRVLRANGTNWVETTSTFADTYTSGNILYASSANTVVGLSNGTANQLLGMNNAAGLPEFKTLNGTTNRITVTHAANSITLNTPQDIHTSATPTFGSLNLTASAPIITLTESDQTDPAGRYRIVLDSDNISFRRAQSAATWSGESTILSIANNGIGVLNGIGADSNIVYIKDGNNRLKERIINTGVWNFNYDQNLLTSSSVTFTGLTNNSTTIATRMASTASAATQIPVFTADPSATTRTLVTRTPVQLKSDLGMANVENTALSTWAGTTNITTLGTIATGTWNATTIAVDRGGTGQTTYVNGEILIGNTTGNTLTKSTLTQGTGVTITNGTGSITIGIGQAVATTSNVTFNNITGNGIVQLNATPQTTLRSIWIT